MVDRVSDETLMAYADEALSRAEMLRVEALVARDPALAARLVPFVVTRSTLPKIFSDAQLGPIPSRLLDTVMSAPMATAKQPVATSGMLAGLRNILFPETWPLARALALCGTVAVIAGAGWMMSRAGQPGERLDLLAMENGKTLARGVLARALETAPMLQQVADSGGAAATPVVTFRNSDGQLCRQFEASQSKSEALSGYACRDELGNWQVGFYVSGAKLTSTDDNSEAIRPADRPSNPDLDAAIDAIISGDVLDVKSEAALIAVGWKSTAVNTGD